MDIRRIKIGESELGRRNSIIIIAGPCGMESRDLALNVAEKLKLITEKHNLPLIFKSSFDKANRTSINSFRGRGMEESLSIFTEIKETYQVPVTTDIHLPEQAAMVAEVIDLIQIPAFLCRQTDLLEAAAKTGLPVNIKKGQFMAPWDMKNVIEKVESTGNHNIILTERGTTFGYNNLVVDMTGLVEMRSYGYPVVFDATHSVQKPGGMGCSTGGNRLYAKYLAYAATAVGIDGLFIETHPDPDQAFSDGPNMVKLNDLDEILYKVVEINNISKRVIPDE